MKKMIFVLTMLLSLSSSLFATNLDLENILDLKIYDSVSKNDITVKELMLESMNAFIFYEKYQGESLSISEDTYYPEVMVKGFSKLVFNAEHLASPTIFNLQKLITFKMAVQRAGVKDENDWNYVSDKNAKFDLLDCEDEGTGYVTYYLTVRHKRYILNMSLFIGIDDDGEMDIGFNEFEVIRGNYTYPGFVNGGIYTTRLILIALRDPLSYITK